MVCVQCGAKTQVFNSRHQKKANQVWRRRRCQACGAVFTTEETAQYSSIWAVKGNGGRLRPFNRDKLLLSLYRSCEHRKTALEDASGLVDTIIGKLLGQANNGVIEARAIAGIAQVALNRFDMAASVHYAAHHK